MQPTRLDSIARCRRQLFMSTRRGGQAKRHSRVAMNLCPLDRVRN
jgi:hypothetical protein